VWKHLREETLAAPAKFAPNLQGVRVLGASRQLAEVVNNCIDKNCLVVTLQGLFEFSSQHRSSSHPRNADRLSLASLQFLVTNILDFLIV
jgi:hypothetical protein